MKHPDRPPTGGDHRPPIQMYLRPKAPSAQWRPLPRGEDDRPQWTPPAPPPMAQSKKPPPTQLVITPSHHHDKNGELVWLRYHDGNKEKKGKGKGKETRPTIPEKPKPGELNKAKQSYWDRMKQRITTEKENIIPFHPKQSEMTTVMTTHDTIQTQNDKASGTETNTDSSDSEPVQRQQSERTNVPAVPKITAPPESVTGRLLRTLGLSRKAKKTINKELKKGKKQANKQEKKDKQSEKASAIARNDGERYQEEQRPEFIEEMRKHGMTPKQFHEVITHLHLLPPDYQRLALKSPVLPILPFSLFHIETTPNSYSEHDRRVGRYLYKQDPAFLRTLVSFDLMAIRNRPETTIHSMRLYCFHKYGLQNKEILGLLDVPNMQTLKRDGVRREQPPATAGEQQTVPTGAMPKTAPIPQESSPQYIRVSQSQSTHTQATKPQIGIDQPRDDMEGPSDMRQKHVKPSVPKNPLGIELRHLKTAKDKSSEGSIEKRTLGQLTNQPPPPKKAKPSVREPQNPAETEWEIMDNTLTYRTAAIAIKNHELQQQIQPSQQDSAMSDSEAICMLSQSTNPTSTKESEQPQFPGSQETSPLGATELKFKDQPNNLSVEERLRMAQRKMTHGHALGPDWVSPQARRIFRCTLCGVPISSNGVERAIRSHLKREHSNVKERLLISVERASGRTFQFVIPGGPPPIRRTVQPDVPAYGPNEQKSEGQAQQAPLREYTTDLEFDWSKEPKPADEIQAPTGKEPHSPQQQASQITITSHGEDHEHSTNQHETHNPTVPELEQQAADEMDSSDAFESDQEEDNEKEQEEEEQPWGQASNKPPKQA